MTPLNLRQGFLAATVLFTAAMAGGWLFSQAAAPLLLPALENMAAAVEQAGEINTELGQVTLAVFIFLKNLSVAAVVVLFGYVLFALPTVFVLLVNGALLGLLARLFITEAGHSPMAFVAGIAPHGVIELPAILLAAGFALALAARRFQNRSIPGLGQRFGFLFRVIAPLLFLAAIIEAFVTPVIMAPFFS